MNVGAGATPSECALGPDEAATVAGATGVDATGLAATSGAGLAEGALEEGGMIRPPQAESARSVATATKIERRRLIRSC